MKSILTLFALCFSFVMIAQTPSGELKRWHKITLSFNGPNTSETANTNPFSDYRLDVTFTHSASGASYKVAGFYAACEDAKNTSCDAGDVWKAHFAPGEIGVWNWSASFTSGSDVALNGGGSSAGFMDGDTGSFTIAESDKTGRDHRSMDKGRLQYVGEHYLQYSGTDSQNPNGAWFVKAGADSPENMLAYEDFDNTPNIGSRRKSWTPHQTDYVAGDAADYTWDGGKGTEMLGVVNYLSGEGANAFSFLTFSLGGDDENVFPHLMKVSENVYNGYGDAQQWSDGVYKDRFDVSKLDQWESIFEYADKKGMYLHFKTLETENDQFMDGGNSLGRERKLYYRELVARFGHHLALNWNLSEESSLDSDVIIDNIEYLDEIDAYHHNVVLHTYPGQKDEKYDPLLGSNSKLTGASLQSQIGSVHGDVITWVANSRNANRKWVTANDEQGPASTGVRVSDKQVREDILYGTLMAGGAGVEYYYGYTNTDGDLNNQDHRLRGVKYEEAGYAISFFENHFNEYLIDAISNDGLTSDSSDYVLANDGEAYAVYLPDGGTTTINLPSGTWYVQWFNPRDGGDLSSATEITNAITAPDSNDWVAFITGESNNTGCDNIENVTVSEDAYLQGTTRFDAVDLRVESGTRVTYLQFTMPSFSEIITAAKLQLTVSGDGGNGLIEIFEGDSNNWTEETLSDANKPAEGDIIGMLNTTYTEGQSYEWNLSGISSGETISLIIKQTGGNDVSFSSKEGANAPRLVLELDCPLSVDEISVSSIPITLYPNPARNAISLDGIKNKAKAAIYDILGKEVISNIQISPSEGVIIDVSSISPGTYFLVLEMDTKRESIQFLKVN